MNLERARTFASRTLDAAGLKRGLVLALNRLGQGAGLRTGDLRLDGELFLRRSDRRLLESMASAGGRRVLMSGPVGSADGHAVGTAMIGLGLRLRGADARFLLCDSALRACELVHATMFVDADAFVASGAMPRCAGCSDITSSTFRGYGVPVFPMSERLSREDYERSLSLAEGLTLREILTYQHQGVDLGEHVRTSLHRFFLVGRLSDDDARLRVARRFLATAIQLHLGLVRLFGEWRPDVVLTYHGIYLTGGVCLAVAKGMGIRVVSWDLVYRRHCAQFSHGETYHHEFRNEPTEAWEGLDLSLEQNRRLDTYLALRRGGALSQDSVSYNDRTEADPNRIAQYLRLDPNRHKVVIFTNVAWDGRVRVDSNLYEGPTELVVGTIRHLADRPDVQVIVRIHPAEARETAWRGLQRVDEEVDKAFPRLPANVVVIPPEDKVNSYALAGLADVAVVYSTMMGLETLLMGKQVIITGDAYYSNKGFGVQPATRREYLAVLDNVASIVAPDHQTLQRVRRYAYHFYFRRWLQLPYPYYGGPSAPIARTLIDLVPGRHNDFDRVCAGILDGRPFHVGAP